MFIVARYIHDYGDINSVERLEYLFDLSIYGATLIKNAGPWVSSGVSQELTEHEQGDR